MGSTSRRGDSLSFFESKTPHFFKIILDDVLRQGKLEIPRNFMARYGSSMPNSVCLEVPSGESWPVEMSKHGNDGWFQNGWQEFVEHYSLDYGHFLVFEHDGGSSFKVLIFDTSATEIRYPTISSKVPKRAGEQREPVEERAEDDAINGVSISHRERKRSSLPFPCRHKKARNDLTSQRQSPSKPLPNFRKIDSASKIPEELGGVQPSCQKEKSEALQRASTFRSENPDIDPSLGGKKTSGNRKGKKPTCENVEAALRANAFKSANPYFPVTLKQSYIDKGVGLTIPAEFAKKHLTEKQSGVAFCVCNGRTWPVLYKRKPDRSSFYYGWKEFVKGNSLKDGDFCVFELIEVNKITFKVSIFRANGSMSKLAGEQMEPVEGRAEDDASCKIINGFSLSRKGRKRSSLPCPRRLKKERNDLTSQTKSTSKPLPYFRKIDSANKIPEEFGGVQPSCQMEKSEALQRANSFRSEHPNFMMVMAKSYVYRRDGYLGIPAKFCKTYIGKKQCDVSLCVSDDRNWPVKYMHHANQSSGRLISGWKGFVRENNLKVHDVCIFELIDISEIKFRVSIFRVDENPNIDPSLGGKKMRGNHKGTKKTCENVEALLRANNFKSLNQYFLVTLNPSYIDRVGLAIPAKFARKHLTKNHSGVTLCVPNGRTWLVQYRRKPNRSRFYYGWKEFVKDNGLKAGDHCVFELIEVNEITFKVSIFEGNESVSSLSE